ncbi:MAG: LamG-like jellyroll fold domain-containing protein [bacterium]|nr:LamG-like jellyroll fold domain-containing protein [bacterium]
MAVIHVQAAANDSSIQLKKDPSSGLFTLTVRDPDGIQEFSLSPVGQSRYGGGLSGCNKTFSNNNVLLDSDGFVPMMPAYVIDCNNNTTELEILPPVNGVTNSKAVKKEVPPPPPPPPPPQEEQKEGPLSAEDIQYPVSELGNCQSDTECRSYCDNADRAKACFTFAKKYHLISEEEAEEAADKFLNVKNGPGGCNSGSSCEDYCNSVDHLDACIAFAEETGYYSPEELVEARKFQALVKAGTKFPGGCKDRNTCEIYCGDSNHMEECLDFAEESGFMPKEEVDEARKFMTLMRQGESPGGCTSKEQCENYCFEENHTDECITFAEKAGVMSAEEATMARKVGGKGPGGCRSKTQCEAYCEANSEECFNFAQEHGLISEDDLQEMREGMARFREELDKMPPEAVQCMKDAAGEENFNKMLAGEPVFDRGIEGKMKSCFRELTSQVSQQFNTLPPEAVQCIKDVIGEEGLQKLQSGEFTDDIDFSTLEGCFQQLQSSFGGGPGGPGGSGGFAGPGGCKSIDECTAYCQSHMDECQQFAPPGGGEFPSGPGGQGGFSGPGGCTNPEECQTYCQSHQEECKNFSPPGGGGFPGSGAVGGQFPDGVSGSEGEQGGFSECGIVAGAVAEYVCAVNGRGAPSGVETTYFNVCHAKQHGAEILHDSGCKGHNPCSDIADPVCGNDGNSWVSACHAEEKGGGVKHKGVCTSEDLGGSGGSGSSSGFSGPGGCQSQEECEAYCQAHPTECGVMPPPPPTQSCAPLPSGLVSWLDDDDTFSSNTASGVALAPGKVGNALKFNASGGYIKDENSEKLNFGTGPFSLEAWFNWDGGGSSKGNIIRKANYPVSGDGAGYWLAIGKDKSVLEFFSGETVGNPDKPRGNVSLPIRSEVWYHVAATRNGNGTMSLYIDGQLKGTAEAAGADTTSPAPFTLGAWDDRFGITELFSGLIDDASAYNRALSTSEIQAIFNAGSNGKCTSSSESQYQQPYQQSQPLPGFIGPGGCTTPEECTTYCMANYQDPACQQFGPGSQADPLNKGFFARILDAFGPLLGIR